MQFKKVVSANLSQEYTDKMNAAYPEIMGHSNPVTFREYLERLIDRATAAPPAPTDLKELAELTTALENANQQLADKQHIIETLRLEASQQPIDWPIKKGEHLVQLDPVQDHVIWEMSEIESRRTKQEITPPKILAHLFKHQIFDGPGNWLPKIYTISDLQKIKRTIEREAATQTPQENEQ